MQAPACMEILHDNLSGQIFGARWLSLKIVQLMKWNCDYRMPLMDLLVHAASTHHFNPSDYAVYNPNAKFPSLMTPSTPVGELSTTVVQIVPKNSPLMNTLGKPNKLLSAKPRGGEEPFEVRFHELWKAIMFAIMCSAIIWLSDARDAGVDYDRSWTDGNNRLHLVYLITSFIISQNK